MEHAVIATPMGLLQLEGTSDGLSSVLFIETDVTPSSTIPDVLEDAATQLQEYFSGERTTFSLKLDPLGTDFQRRVWRELETIPFGKTTSYLAMAKQLGDAKVIRAAASANGKNPISIIIPCHRVIGSDGSLTGYAGGLHRKKWLLAHESPVIQGSLF
ncbi:methylated-DNA--[protein]-cysteine S-methyltransferase [uncultured Dokdonia sp.]|uniref:methylated-DNA--[protein]-cysteine S-methyltransferase n=1 Tax=uncultured Dokdonia sp. TaxID=575653 RepID=UPI0030EF7847|tara:strand:- start:28491 stop:28964 length:474 start_codon:yes stop_codon:yes gene_type:complete